MLRAGLANECDSIEMVKTLSADSGGVLIPIVLIPTYVRNTSIFLSNLQHTYIDEEGLSAVAVGKYGEGSVSFFEM